MKRWTLMITGELVLTFLAATLEAQAPGEGPGRPGGPPGRGMSPIVAALDADGDGVLSAQEIEGAAAALKKLDKDGDGKLTREELRPEPGRGPQGEGRDRPGEGAPPGRGARGGRGEGGPGGGAFESSAQPKDDAEKKILEVLNDISGNRRGNMNVPVNDGRFLRLLAESIGAKQVVELGTSTGYSGTWFCMALRKTGGKLTTFEVDAKRAATARENFKRAGVEEMVTLVEGDAHEKVTTFKGTIDLLFLDADKEGYIDYYQKLLPQVRPGGLIVAHNISGGMADPKYIKAITSSGDVETVFINVGSSGISVTLKKI